MPKTYKEKNQLKEMIRKGENMETYLNRERILIPFLWQVYSCFVLASVHGWLLAGAPLLCVGRYTWHSVGKCKWSCVDRCTWQCVGKWTVAVSAGVPGCVLAGVSGCVLTGVHGSVLASVQLLCWQVYLVVCLQV